VAPAHRTPATTTDSRRTRPRSPHDVRTSRAQARRSAMATRTDRMPTALPGCGRRMQERDPCRARLLQEERADTRAHGPVLALAPRGPNQQRNGRSQSTA
jgi:hypothetical protein